MQTPAREGSDVHLQAVSPPTQASGLDRASVPAYLGPACLAGTRVQGPSPFLASLIGMACLSVSGATQEFVLPPLTLSLSLG